MHIDARPMFMKPPNRYMLLYFISYLAYSRRMTYNGIKPYIYDVRHWCMTTGFPDPTCYHGRTWHKYRSLVTGVKRATTQRKRVRKPLRIIHVRKIITSLRQHSLAMEDQLAFKAALLVAFFGFLRCSEYTRTQTNAECFLRRKDIKIYPTYKKKGVLRLRLRKTKTDQFAASTVTIFGNGKDICPVKSIQEYFTYVDVAPQEPLFWFSNRPLTNKKFNSLLKRIFKKLGLNEKLYSSHSLRSGAATTAVSHEVPAWLIQTLGRWNSGCYKIYIPQPTSAISRAHSAMTS